MSNQPTGKRPNNCYRDPKSPFWQYEFTVNGERERGSTRQGSARDAAAFVAERKTNMRRRQAANLDGNGKRVREKITIAAACDIYESKVGKIGKDGVVRCDPTTDYQLGNLVAILCERDDHRLVSDVETSDFERYRLRRPSLVPPGRENRAPIKGSSINREIELARRVWRYAARLGYDIGETIVWSDVIDKSEEVSRIRELTASEEQRLLPALEAINPDLRVAAEFAMFCGQRKAALIGIRWSDINWETAEITVLLKTRGETKRPHKFPLTNRMIEIIQSRPKVGPFVFTYICSRNAPRRPDRVGRIKGERYPMSLSGWTRQWRKALANAQIVDFRWHDLRHTAATRLLRQVNNLKAAQNLLGHQSIDQTARYAHVFSDDLREMMEQAEAGHIKRSEKTAGNNARRAA